VPLFWLAGVLLEGGQELSDVLLRRHEEEHVLEHPSLIVHALVVRGLERIRAQIEELGQEFLRAREVQHREGKWRPSWNNGPGPPLDLHGPMYGRPIALVVKTNPS
jgi:hypothetical protein